MGQKRDIEHQESGSFNHLSHSLVNFWNMFLEPKNKLSAIAAVASQRGMDLGVPEHVPCFHKSPRNSVLIGHKSERGC